MLGGNRARQMYRSVRVLDGENPAVAGDIPKKLIVVFEQAELAIGGIGNRVDMTAPRDHCVGIAQVDALAVRNVLDAKGFVAGIARGREHLEADHVAVVERIAIVCGKVAIDAMADLVAGCDHVDGFSDLQGRVVLKSNVAVKTEDLLGLSPRRQTTTQSNQES